MRTHDGRLVSACGGDDGLKSVRLFVAALSWVRVCNVPKQSLESTTNTGRAETATIAGRHKHTDTHTTERKFRDRPSVERSDATQRTHKSRILVDEAKTSIHNWSNTIAFAGFK